MHDNRHCLNNCRMPRLVTFFCLLGLLLTSCTGVASSTQPTASATRLYLPLIQNGAAMTPPPATFRVLVFSKTAGFRHGSIGAGLAAIRQLASQHNFSVDATEDSNAFSDANLAQYQALVFLQTTGDLLDENQQNALQRYIRAGGGFVGIHAAADAEYDWPWYGELVGAYFKSHPAIQQATLVVENRTHPSTRQLPERWTRTDEWYNFRTNPRPNVSVLISLDESSYQGGEMGDHPIAWFRPFEGGRTWYTGLGHTDETFSEPLFQQHLLGGILWAAGQATLAGGE